MANNSKKPGPAQRPVVAKAAPAPAPIDDLDEDLGDGEDDDAEDEGGAGVNGAKTISNGRRRWMATQRLAPSKREAVLIGNLVNKLGRREDIIKGWSVAGAEVAKASIAEALELLRAAATALAGIDSSWRPATARGNGASSSTPLEAGSLVKITDRSRKEYLGVIPDDAMRGIKVKELRGNRVVVVMNDGVQAMFPRGHVCLDA